MKCELCGGDVSDKIGECLVCSSQETRNRIKDVIHETIGILSQKLDSGREEGKLCFIIGNFYRLSGRLDDAIPFYERAIRAVDAIPEYYRCLGTAYASKGDYGDAVSCIEKAVSQAPRYPDFRNDLGSVYFKLGRYDEALKEFQEAVAINPRYARAHNNLGLAYRKQKKYEEADQAIQKAVQLDPGHANADYQLGLSYSDGGMFSPPRRSSMMNAKTLGDIYFLRGRLPDAVEQYRIAVKLYPGYADYNLALGKACIAAGNKQEARPYIQKALEINPNYAEAQEAFAQLD